MATILIDVKSDRLKSILGKKKHGEYITYLLRQLGYKGKVDNYEINVEVDETLFDIIEDKIETLKRQNKNLKKENDQYSTMKLCTKKNGCKHAMDFSEDSSKVPRILSTNAINRIFRAHLISSEKFSSNKYTVFIDFKLFIAEILIGEAGVNSVRQGVGMSKETYQKRSSVFKQEFLYMMMSNILKICKDEMYKVSSKDINIVLEEYIKIFDPSLSDSEIDKVINALLPYMYPNK